MPKYTKYIAVVFLLLASCVKETNWPLPEADLEQIVVEATLTNEFGRQAIYLSYPVSTLNEDPSPVEGAGVSVSDQENDFILDEDPDEPGTYWTDSVFIGLLNRSYTLQVFHENIFISAQASMVPGQFFSPLTYVKNDDNDLYHIDFVASNFDPTYSAKWEVLINWSMVAGYENADPDTCQARMLFYTLPTLDVSQIFAPGVEEVSFPAGSIIIQRRYSLSTGHATYVRELLLETTWQGSMFPTANANVHSNLSTGGLGYFGVCFVTEVTFIVNRDL